ncbi:MAG: electron transfer flavoprotein subunit alpha/FixB family protein, partial [Euryarchaeota archaeon]|nr:electron transfer flavoprotein subunit alpha/FixB family protein [Euryarchaeota archaeon]
MAVAEHREGKVVATTYELVTKGRDLAAKAGGAFYVALFGHNVGGLAAQIAERGADVLHADHEALATYTPGGYAQALAAVREAYDPKVVLLSHTSQGFDLAPRLAGEWEAPILANVVDVALEHGALVVSRKILNDKIAMDLEARSERPYVVTLRLGSAKPARPAERGTVTPIRVSVDPAKNGRTFLGYEKPQVQDIDIAAADIVVSAGRGIQKKENLAIIEGLAKALGGVVG